jgi:hypothetical protein
VLDYCNYSMCNYSSLLDVRPCGWHACHPGLYMYDVHLKWNTINYSHIFQYSTYANSWDWAHGLEGPVRLHSSHPQGRACLSSIRPARSDSSPVPTCAPCAVLCPNPPHPRSTARPAPVSSAAAELPAAAPHHLQVRTPAGKLEAAPRPLPLSVAHAYI